MGVPSISRAAPNLGTRFTNPVINDTSAAFSFANLYSFAELLIPAFTTITGLIYWVGSTSNGNVISGLHDAAGNKIAFRTTGVAQATAGHVQKVDFDAPVAVSPGKYIGGIAGSSGTGTYRAGLPLTPTNGTLLGGFSIPASITPPTDPFDGNSIVVATY